MSATKRSFIKAGAILAIILAVTSIISCFSLIPMFKGLNEDLVKEILIEEDYVYYDQPDGGYYLEHIENGKVTDDEVKTIAKLGKGVIITIIIVDFGLSVAMFTLSIIILKNLTKAKSKKSQIIAMLVLSALTGSTLTLAFMIVALCIKDKPKVTLQNVNEIANAINMDKPNLSDETITNENENDEK